MSSKAPAGVSLLEIVISIGILMLVVPAISALALGSIKGVTRNEQELEAMALAHEGLEAARAIRDHGWDELSVGTHGLSKPSGYWAFSGSSETLGIYQRNVAAASVDSNRKTVTSTVTWSPNKSTTLTARLTNWRANFGLEWIQTTETDFSSARDLHEITVIAQGDGAIRLEDGHEAGDMQSSRFNTGSGSTVYQTISWVKSGDAQGTVKFRIRTSNSDSGLNGADWLGPDGTKNTYYTVSGTPIVAKGGTRWMQYQAFLNAPPNKTPILESVTIQYAP